MPEATIYKNRDIRAWKNEIRLTEYPGIPSPAPDPGPAKDFDQSQLCVAISTATNTRHDLRAFGSCEYVGHNAAYEHVTIHTSATCHG